MNQITFEINVRFVFKFPVILFQGERSNEMFTELSSWLTLASTSMFHVSMYTDGAHDQEVENGVELIACLPPVNPAS